MSAKVRGDAFSDTQIMSTGFAFIGVTSFVALARLSIYFVAPRRPTVEDGLVFLAYISNIAMCSLYISLAPRAQQLSNVKAGKIPPYPTIKNDGKFISRRYFVAPLIFWLLLWSIKFSFLLMYRKLLAGIPRIYTHVWWSIVLFCVATQAGNFAAYLTACSDISLLVNGGCKDMTTTRQLISLLYSYGADTLTNIMIMALPIRLVWNLQMAQSKKIGVMGLFATGAVCIVVATVRVAQITKNVYEFGMGIDGTWLAIWGMVECSIAVIVGFVPAFAVLFRIRREKKSSYNPYGYQKQEEGQYSEREQSVFAMNTIASKTSRKKEHRGLDTTEPMWVDNASSQEELSPATPHHGITVTTTLQ